MDQIRDVAEIIIGKQRHGPIGTVKLHYNENITKFGNLARDDRFERRGAAKASAAPAIRAALVGDAVAAAPVAAAPTITIAVITRRRSRRRRRRPRSPPRC